MSATPVQGQQSATSGGDEFNAITFVVRQLLALVSTAKVVKVVACTNTGDLSPVGYVDVQPLVNQIDGAGKAMPHGIIYGLPYSRIQGGANAIILDPQPGDIGVAVFADRDISNVKATRKQSNPGSFRKFDPADGVYLGMVMNAMPEQYLQFNAAGITVFSPHQVTVNSGDNTVINAGGDVDVTAGGQAHIVAPECVIDAATTNNGNVVINGTLTVSNGVKSPSYAGLTAGTGMMTVHQATIDTATVAGKLVDTHTHSDPQGGNTGPMQ